MDDSCYESRRMKLIYTTDSPTPQNKKIKKIYKRIKFNCDKSLFSLLTAAVVAVSDMMPGQIPDPSLAAGSLPSLGPLAGISATTLTDQLKLADFRQLGTMLSPLHFLGRLGKRPLAIKTEVRRKRREEIRGNSTDVVYEQSVSSQ